MSSFIWNNELVFELIRLYKDKPELWDTSLEEYKNKDKKQKYWLEIANSMNTDVDEVQRKMKMLTSQYRRELLKRPTNSKWFAFKPLSFLKIRQMAVALKNRQITSPTYFISVDREEQKSKPYLLSDIKRREQAAIKDRISYVKEKGKETQNKDEYTTYGELVAMKLKKIENSYARSTAQYHINNILYKAEIGAYDKHETQSKSNKSREFVRAGGTSTFQRQDSDYDDDEHESLMSSSPTKSMDDINVLKLETEDSDE